MNLQNSETFKNLHAAWAAETQACAKYEYFADKAKKDGLSPAADVFYFTAQNERAHGKIWYDMIEGKGEKTCDDIKNAIDGENHEWTQMYREYENTARKEGFYEIAEKFAAVSKIEESHEKRFSALLEELRNNGLFCGEDSENCEFICKNCGYIHNAEKAPDVCPVCGAPRSAFLKA